MDWKGVKCIVFGLMRWGGIGIVWFIYEFSWRWFHGEAQPSDQVMQVCALEWNRGGDRIPPISQCPGASLDSCNCSKRSTPNSKKIPDSSEKFPGPESSHTQRRTDHQDCTTAQQHSQDGAFRRIQPGWSSVLPLNFLPIYFRESSRKPYLEGTHFFSLCLIFESGWFCYFSPFDHNITCIYSNLSQYLLDLFLFVLFFNHSIKMCW